MMETDTLKYTLYRISAYIVLNISTLVIPYDESGSHVLYIYIFRGANQTRAVFPSPPYKHSSDSRRVKRVKRRKSTLNNREETLQLHPETRSLPKPKAWSLGYCQVHDSPQKTTRLKHQRALADIPDS